MDEIDPSQRLQLHVLEEEYRRRHGVGIDWLKAAVGEGDVFENGVGRVVLSGNGGWFECIDLPMEFTGLAGGPLEHQFVSDARVMQLIGRLLELAADTPGDIAALSVLMLYGRAGLVDEQAAFVFQLRRGPHGEERKPIHQGTAVRDDLPAVIKCRIEANRPVSGLPLSRGAFVCLRGVGEKNLLVFLPHEGDDLRDLGAVVPGSLPN